MCWYCVYTILNYLLVWAKPQLRDSNFSFLPMSCLHEARIWRQSIRSCAISWYSTCSVSCQGNHRFLVGNPKTWRLMIMLCSQKKPFSETMGLEETSNWAVWGLLWGDENSHVDELFEHGRSIHMRRFFKMIGSWTSDKSFGTPAKISYQVWSDTLFFGTPTWVAEPNDIRVQWTRGSEC